MILDFEINYRKILEDKRLNNELWNFVVFYLQLDFLIYWSVSQTETFANL